MSQIIINGQPLYQVDLPEMTLAEWLALPVAERPKEWIRTDAEYTDIPAENVSYGSGSVKDALDDELTPSTGFTFVTGNTSYISNIRRSEYAKVGKVVTFSILFDVGSSPINGSVIFTLNNPNLFPKINTSFPLIGTHFSSAYQVYLNSNGNIEFGSLETLPSAQYCTISGTYICV